jgi:predicted transcriptional regulator YheO
MDNEYRNSKIGKAASILYHKLEEGERALNNIISEKFSKEENMNTEDMNLKIGEAAGVLYHRLEEGECTLSQIKNHLVKNGFDSSIALMAIGWLAREDKILAYKTSNIWSLKLN